MDKEFIVVFALILFTGIMCFLFGTVCGTESQKDLHRSLLVEKGICKYEINQKTGKTELVLISDGKPFYGEDK